MKRIGIEKIYAYVGESSLNVRTLFSTRQLDLSRFDNLMMAEKTVALNFEDAISFAVNAAKPILDSMNEEEKNKIELLIVGTESGIDFGKSISNYVHRFLDLKKNCRMFEVKQACYSGTAALQMALSFVQSSVFDDVKALVICTDVARPVPNTYVEPSQGAGAIAILISNDPKVLEFDQGANGYYGYEVMDTCRPNPEIEAGDVDLSLLSYLNCLQGAFENYCDRVDEADFQKSFDYLSLHTPFPGMVKGAHRHAMRKFKKLTLDDIEQDFELRIMPSLKLCAQVGNIYAGTVYLALISTLLYAPIEKEARIGLFSYGSGCCSEFFSGIANSNAKESSLKLSTITHQLNNRYVLSMDEYDPLLKLTSELKFGVKDFKLDFSNFDHIYQKQFHNKKRLVLTEIKNYNRIYAWS